MTFKARVLPILALGIASTAGLSTTRPGRVVLAPLIAPVTGYRSLTIDPRVTFGAGGEAQALEVARSLDTAIDTVEQALGRPFVDPARVVVHAEVASFVRWTGVASQGATGAVVLDRVHLSPEAFRRRVWRNVLVHELVHLHFRRRMGSRQYVRELPRWFQEGSAVALARGHRPEPFGVSPDSMRRALEAGARFHPEPEGRSPPREGSDYGIGERLFYAQAGAFHGWLRDRDEDAYLGWLRDVEDGLGLALRLEARFGVSLEGLWREFLAPAGA